MAVLDRELLGIVVRHAGDDRDETPAGRLHPEDRHRGGVQILESLLFTEETKMPVREDEIALLAFVGLREVGFEGDALGVRGDRRLGDAELGMAVLKRQRPGFAGDLSVETGRLHNDFRPAEGSDDA